MANEFAILLPNILGQSLIRLRNKLRLARLVKRDFAAEVSEPGQTINFKGRTSFTTNAVTAGSTSIQNLASAGTSMGLDIHREVTWALTDKEAADLQRNKGMVLTDAIEDAVDALANYMNAQVAALYKKFYTMTGVIGTIPDAVADITDVRLAAHSLQWPEDNNRHIVWDGASEAKLLQLAILTDYSSTNDSTVQTGLLGNRFGFMHWTDQAVDDLVHTKGACDTAYVVNGTPAVGATTLPVESGTGDIHEGDMFTIGSTDTQVYVCTAEYAGGAGNVSIAPGLKIQPSNHDALTFKATQSNFSLAFHRDAMGLAIRPLPTGVAPGKMREVVSDPLSGLSMRLTVEGSHAQDVMTLDILGGCGVLNRALGIRVQSGS